MKQGNPAPMSHPVAADARALWLLAVILGLAVAGSVAHAGESNGTVVEEAFPQRDPFWPVGYVPPERAAAGFVTDTNNIAWPALPVRGRSRAPDGTFRVLIDGAGVVGEQKIVSIQSNGRWFHWRILRIDERGVESVRLGITRTRFPAKSAAPMKTVPDEPRKEKTP